MARQQFAVLMIIFTVLVFDSHGYIAHRRVKTQKPGIRSYSDLNENNDINVCSLEQKTTINLFCYCDESMPYLATSADCWVFNDGEPRDASIWKEFKSQSNITKLTFNVRGSTSQTLSFVPTEALAQLPELRTLEIVYADIKTLHSFAFANLSHLQDLALGRNKIVRLSRESIAYMEDLRVVTLGDNYIDGISNDVFAKLPALRKLYMDKNNISYIAEGAFEQLRKLEELDVSDNRLTGSLSRYVFLGLVSLKRLDMRANHIDRINSDAFAELVSLEELVLEDNTIKTIDGRGFSGLFNLQRLTLAENRLIRLDERTFQHLDKLKFIDLKYNNLQSLSFNTIDPILDNLHNTSFIMHLQGNVFNCDCKLLWMNRLAAETPNEHVTDMLSNVECLMNRTNDEADFETTADRKKTKNANQNGIMTVPVYSSGAAYKNNEPATDVGDVSGSVDGYYRSYDDSQLVKVSSMDEDTCPGKEPPIVDGAPDAAQNSDRVLWESKESTGAAVDRRPHPLTLQLLLFSILLVFGFRSHC